MLSCQGDQLHPSLLQGHKDFLSTPQQCHQFQLLSSQQYRQFLLQEKASSLSPALGETDPRKVKYLWTDGSTVKDGQPLGSDRSQGVGSEMHETSSIGRAASQDQNDVLSDSFSGLGTLVSNWKMPHIP